LRGGTGSGDGCCYVLLVEVIVHLMRGRPVGPTRAGEA